MRTRREPGEHREREAGDRLSQSPSHTLNETFAARRGAGGWLRTRGRLLGMSPTWVWMQIAIVVFVVAGMIVAVTKLA
jgi:hypothetical protein